MDEHQKIYFNSSLPRSGSTLLQNILAQNPRFYCSPTSGVVALLHAARIQFNEHAAFRAQDPAVMRAGFLSFCRWGLQGFYAGVTDKPVCVDKSRVWLLYHEWLSAFSPGGAPPRVLLCVRDLRGILSSMEKLWRKGRVFDPGQRDVPALAMTTVQGRVAQWMNSNPVGLGVMGLLDAVQRGTLRHLHVLKYEDLTASPKAAMQKVYAYLGEPYFDGHDFDNVEQVTREDDAAYDALTDHTIRRKVQPVAPDYEQVLGKDVCAQVVRNFPLFYHTFYPHAR